MVYLMILVMVAGVGIGSLLVQQRRERAHLDTVDGFRASLEKISPYSAPGPFRRAIGAVGPSGRAPGRPIPLDPERREAARRRVEARRREALARAHQSTVAPRRRQRPVDASRARGAHPAPRRRPRDPYALDGRRVG